MIWESNVRCNAKYSDLFEAPAIPSPGEGEWSSSEGAILWTDVDWFHDIWRKYGTGVSWKLFMRGVADALATLRARSEIVARVDALSSRYSLRTLAGVHIRHTDNVALYGKWISEGRVDPGSLSTVSGFHRAIERMCKNECFFLSTDNESVELEFRHKYGSRVIVCDKAYHVVDPSVSLRTTGMVDALVDMMLLARCRCVIGTHYSSFSKFSALWGGVDGYEINGDCLALVVRAAKRST